MRYEYRQLILRDRPRVFWPCGDPSSTAPSPDIAGEGTATPTHTGLFYGTQGPGGQGVANGFTEAAASSMVLASGAPNPGDTCSYEIWVRRRFLGTGIQAIIGSVSGGYYLRFNADNTIHMLRSQVVDALGTSTTYTNLEQYIHIVNTNHPTDGRAIWVDGVRRAFTAGVSTGFGNSGSLRLNRENDVQTDYGLQRLWGFAVYDYVLSPAQILEHWNAGRGLSSQNRRRR